MLDLVRRGSASLHSRPRMLRSRLVSLAALLLLAFTASTRLGIRAKNALLSDSIHGTKGLGVFLNVYDISTSANEFGPDWIPE
jgi:hypothetical protein